MSSYKKIKNKIKNQWWHLAIKKNGTAVFVSFGCRPCCRLQHFHVFHTSLSPLFCHRCVCSNIQHPTYELGMQMNLLSPTPPARPLRPLLPPVFSFSFKFRQSSCVGLGYCDWCAGNKSSAPLHQRSAACYRCAEADVSWNWNIITTLWTESCRALFS